MIVPIIEIIIDPRQPALEEKNANMFGADRRYEKDSVLFQLTFPFPLAPLERCDMVSFETDVNYVSESLSNARFTLRFGVALMTFICSRAVEKSQAESELVFQ
jgi:hypothetical protein